MKFQRWLCPPFRKLCIIMFIQSSQKANMTLSSLSTWSLVHQWTQLVNGRSLQAHTSTVKESDPFILKDLCLLPLMMVIMTAAAQSSYVSVVHGHKEMCVFLPLICLCLQRRASACDCLGTHLSAPHGFLWPRFLGNGSHHVWLRGNLAQSSGHVQVWTGLCKYCICWTLTELLNPEEGLQLPSNSWCVPLPQTRRLNTFRFWEYCVIRSSNYGTNVRDCSMKGSKCIVGVQRAGGLCDNSSTCLLQRCMILQRIPQM